MREHRRILASRSPRSLSAPLFSQHRHTVQLRYFINLKVEASTLLLMHSAPISIHRDKIKNCDKCFLFVVFLFVLFMIMKPDTNNLICILIAHLSAIILESFKDLVLIIPEILEFIELHTYKFGLVYIVQIFFHLT